jgi:hypothetical protein
VPLHAVEDDDLVDRRLLGGGRARSMNSEMVIRIFAPESFNWKAISSGVYSELIGDITQPAAAIPWNTTGYQGVFGQKTATTSPLRSPRACRLAATRST